MFPHGDKEMIFQAFSSLAQTSMIIIPFREMGLKFPSVQFTASPGALHRLFSLGEDGKKASLPVKLADPDCCLGGCWKRWYFPNQPGNAVKRDGKAVLECFTLFNPL